MSTTMQTPVHHTGRTEPQLRQELLRRGVPIEMEITEHGQTHRLTASLDPQQQVRLHDPATGREYPSLSAHRGEVFQQATSNTYDAYVDLSTGKTMRVILGLTAGAPR
jgi:hypothetical protein